MTNDQPIVYFNNCHNRDHVALFGSGAFFDLGTSGRQAAQARNLLQGQLCVVVERTTGERLAFGWYSFEIEVLLPPSDSSTHETFNRVFFGKLLASEEQTKSMAAHSRRYSALFKINGNLKNGSVFQGVVPLSPLPTEIVKDRTNDVRSRRSRQSGGGFGDPAENKIVESKAIRAVVKTYEADGWSVRSVERERCGFDLVCSKKGAVENVEVKGVSAAQECFIITTNEAEQARTNIRFVLMVVTLALSASPKLSKYSGLEFRRRFELSPIQYRASLK